MGNHIIGNVTIVGQVVQSTGVILGGPAPDGPAHGTADLARAVTEDLAHPGPPVRLTSGEHRAVLRLLTHLHDTDAPEAAVARDLADRLRGR